MIPLPELDGAEETSPKPKLNKMMDDWVIAKGSVIGSRHIEDQTPCQDAFQVVYNNDLDFGIALISDGAGSAKSSETGSNFIVNKAPEIIESKLSGITFSDVFKKEHEDIENIFIDILTELKGLLFEFSTENEIPFKDLAATVIILLFNAEGLICSHIGDGRAGFLDAESKWHPVLTPFRGELANQTIFLTSDIWDKPEDFIRTSVIKEPIQAFTLMTDGCENATFELSHFNEKTQTYEKANKPFSNFFNPNIEALKTLHRAGKSESDIDQLWRNFLKDGNEKFASELDDKTLILGTLLTKGEQDVQ